MSEPVKSIKIAITAMGGQGGGVLAGWIGKLGEENGFIAQSTSVPGVAQRTGATIYYVELFPRAAAQATDRYPVLSLMPTPGDVDIVIAAEMMEAGRAIARGFVSSGTTLIASSHRDYAISEKSAMGDGRKGPDVIFAAAEKNAARFIIGDMAEAAAEAGSVISSVLFGALAGSGALPIERARYEEQITKMGRAVESNLRGFALGCAIAEGELRARETSSKAAISSETVSPAAEALLKRMREEVPGAAHFFAREGLKRLVDYQDARYAELYMDRLAAIYEIDKENGGDTRDWRLTQTVAKHLALWMSYEDAIRVADLKTRSLRFERFRDDVRAAPGQIVNVSEYMHPRVEEVCDLAPSPLARLILGSNMTKRLLGALLGEGRRISTTKLRGFLPLYALAGLRFLRRASYRFDLETARIESWLNLIEAASAEDYQLAVEIAHLQRLIKGYGDTHERGLRNYRLIIEALPALRSKPGAAKAVAELCAAALKDEEGAALVRTLQKHAAPASEAA